MRDRHSPVSAMAHARFSSLLVIALLQLSQTEISNTLPESWYAANVINEGAYSPKPISEIFSTQPTFSPTNPIVVLSSSPTPNPISYTSSLSSSTPTVTTTITSTERPATEVSVVPLSTEQPPQQSSQSPPITIIFDTQTTQQPQPQLPDLSVFQQPPSPPSPPPILSTPQQIQIQTAPQGTPPPFQVLQNLPPNYFLLYQQAPQTIPSYPQGQAQPFPPPATPTSPQPLIPSTILSTIVTSTVPPTAKSTMLPPSTNPTQAPCTNGSNPNPQGSSYRIRLVAPSGSVTNVRINPYPPTTTTRRPTTTRTRRRNKNSYDGCINGCGGKKIPICAGPLGLSPIDPDTLKGFPSVCHMACHNSFRKNLYEKVMDGRCGRLRTRIRPIDSKNKLKKDDLNKATYTIVQGGPTVVEFSPLVS